MLRAPGLTGAQTVEGRRGRKTGGGLQLFFFFFDIVAPWWDNPTMGQRTDMLSLKLKHSTEQTEWGAVLVHFIFSFPAILMQ